MAIIRRTICILGINLLADGAHVKWRSYKERNHRDIDRECLWLALKTLSLDAWQMSLLL